jgi:murein DD-endopeptidase MepM/ murein hydrolase activator NlpD
MLVSLSRRYLLGIALLFFPSLAVRGQGAVRLTPAVVDAGSPVLIYVDAPANAKLEGKWLGQELEFFRARSSPKSDHRSGSGWYALAGVDVQAPVGPSTLAIQELVNNTSRDMSLAVEIHPGHYRTGALTMAPQFVQPPPAALEEIKAEVALKDKIFSASAQEPLWTGDFRAPVHSPPTDSFGTRRTFNGELASVHKGMDFRAHTGTPVHASNRGVVVLARRLYYEGNCVVIDHGLGLYTLSMHLSRIDVREGQRVAKGQLLGLSGATGRVTGPHLHWAVRWQNAYLDPAKLLGLNLNGLGLNGPGLNGPGLNGPDLNPVHQIP